MHSTWRQTLLLLCASISCLLACSATAWAAPPPVVVEASASNVASSSATLEAQVNPEGIETSYRFEYGTSEAYGASVPVPDGIAGSGMSAVTVQAHTQGLLAHTLYHFRVVLSSAGGTVDGADQTFTTQASGGELTLLDGRQWELVSPPVKDGGRILPLQEGGGSVQAAVDGDAMTYLTTIPPEVNPAGNANETQVLSRRSVGGWSSQNLEPAHSEAIEASIGEGQEYKIFSPDLSRGIVQPFVGRFGGEALLSPEASEYTPYLHDNAAGNSAGYLPLVTAANVPAGIKFGEGFATRRVRYIGATPDLSHVVLQAQAALTTTPAERAVYEWTAGRLQLVNLLPGRSVAAQCADIGQNNDENARGAISDDGSRIVWNAGAGCETPEEVELYGEYENHLFLRDTAKGETIQLDAIQGGSGGGGEPRPEFALATGDGSRVFFTDGTRLTADATANGSPGLYECAIVEVASKLTCELSDLTVDENPSESADVNGGVLGASEDGSYVYFVANGVLAPGAAPQVCGSEATALCNLYLRHDGKTTFIAALSREDAEWSSVGHGSLRRLTARVSPNGRYLEFMSERSLTGYDTRDASSGVPDEEVYLYDAQSGWLVCASCNPTGARPVGIAINSQHEPLAANERIWGEGRWLAASVPGWTGIKLDAARYQSRYLADSGRLYFNSSDALVAQDTNGVEDVYEYEPAGVGSCTAASATFSEHAAGCVDLVSSGTSAEESAFMDASENGDDVFFITSGRLVAADFDDGYDVYDAHVCSAAMPCPAPVAALPACTTADSCRTAPAPQPGVFGAPASATFSGSGNPPAAAAPLVRAKQPKVKAKAKKRAKHKKHSKHVKRRRRGRSKHATIKQSLSARTGR